MFSEGPERERAEVFRILSTLNPTRTARYEQIIRNR